MVNVGTRIKNFLEANNMSQTDLSVLTGIALPKINLMLNGKRRMPLDEYEVICYTLKVPVGSFLEAKKPHFLDVS